MNRTEKWKLADELTIFQIALLIAGYDPAEFEDDQHHMWPDTVRQDISPYLNAVKNAAKSKRLDFTPAYYDQGYNGPVEVDWTNSTVNIDSLREWLRLRNFTDGYFIASQGEVDNLADPANEFYAPKLAAAVRAWREVTSDPEALNGKTPKKALEVWLRKHANEYGLTNKDGNPNEQGIEEVCKVANWKPNGGASPTPTPLDGAKVELAPTGRRVRPRPPTRSKQKGSFGKISEIIDDEIPF